MLDRLLSCFSTPGIAHGEARTLGTEADPHRNGYEQHKQAPCPEMPSSKVLTGPHHDLALMEHARDAARACPPAPSQDGAPWESLVMEAIPFSLAVVSSDGTEVLHHVHGSEPAAAQALRQALQQFGHPASAQVAEDMQQAAAGASSSSTCSFLAALLGSEVANNAMRRVHKGRSWKGAVTMHLPCGTVPGSPPLSGAHVNTPTATTAEAAAAAVGVASVDEVPSKSVSIACEAKSILRQSSILKGAELGLSPQKVEPDDPLCSLDGSLRRASSYKGVRWSSQQTDCVTSFQNGGDANFFMLSNDSKDPHEVALPGDLGGLQVEMGAQTLPEVSSVPTNTGINAMSAAAISFTETYPAPYRESLESFGGRSEMGSFGRHFEAGEKFGWRSGAASAAEAPHGLATPRSKSLSSRRSRSRNSLLKTEKEIEQLMLGSSDSGNNRTVAFLKSLSRQVETADASQQSPFERAGSIPGGGVSSHDAIGVDQETKPDEPEFEPMLWSFDIFLALLKPAERETSPLVVLISNSTQHLQVQSTLSALAESQLELLSGIMPQHAIQFLALESTEAVSRHVAELAHAHKGVTLLFMDIVGFTSMSKNVEPVDVMVFLNTLFSIFDQLTDLHGVHKVETAGDCYIVSGGIMSPKQSPKEFAVVEEDQDPKESAMRVMSFAKAMLDAAQQVKMPDTKEPVRVRVGMHTGDVVSGLIGSKLPKFSIFGDTMNTASRMESTGAPGRIHVSDTTHALLQHSELWEPTGGVEVKGKGVMQTFLWVPQPPQQPSSRQMLQPIFETSAESLPSVLLKKTHALLNQLHMPVPALKPSSQDVVQTESLALLNQLHMPVPALKPSSQDAVHTESLLSLCEHVVQLGNPTDDYVI